MHLFVKKMIFHQKMLKRYSQFLNKIIHTKIFYINVIKFDCDFKSYKEKLNIHLNQAYILIIKIP